MTRIKRTNILLVVVVIILMLLPSMVLPLSAESTSGNCGDNLQWSFNPETGLLKISGSGPMTDIKVSGYSPWYMYRNDIKSVSFPEGMTTIGAYSFKECSALTGIHLPNSVTEIGERAFSDCTSMTSVVIPDGVQSIGDYAFAGCSNLASVKIGTGLTSLGSEAFINTAIKSDANSKQNGVIYIDKWAVDLDYDDLITGTNSTFSVDIRTSTVGIACSAFSSVYGMESITIPNTVKYINDSAFRGCPLTSVLLPKSVIAVDHFAFCDCRQLTDVTIINKNCIIYDEKSTFGIKEGTLIYPVYTAKATIHGFENSTAQSYSQKYNYTFDILTSDPTQAVFVDVPANAFYAKAVDWAVENGITNGVNPTHFAPNDICTRGHVVTFLWRAAGSPNPKTTTNPFQDVRQKDYFYKAVLWAVENGITSGTSKTKFSPNDACTRAQVVTFLWRYEKQQKPKSSANPFKDVTKNAYYYKAVLWAVERGITQGTSKTRFSPNDTCTRGQIVTFLYRDMVN